MKELLLYGTIKDGQLLIDRREIFDAWLKSVKKPARAEIVIGPIRRDKTTQQLRYFHGVVITTFADECGYTKKEAKGILKRTFLTFNRNTNKEYVESLGDLSIKEMSEFLDNCVLWLAENGVYCPEPPADLKG